MGLEGVGGERDVGQGLGSHWSEAEATTKSVMADTGNPEQSIVGKGLVHIQKTLKSRQEP